MEALIISYFAAAYGQGNYGGSTYACANGETNCDVVTTTTTSTSTLTNTGIAVVTIVTIACVIIFIALLAHFLRRKRVSKDQA